MPIKTAKRIPRVTRDHIALVLVCLGLGGFGAGGTLAINHIDKQSENSVDKSTLETSCEKFGNTMRAGLREYFEDELERAKEPPPEILSKFGLTKQEARELGAEHIEQLEYDINVRFKNVPCREVYDK